MIPNKFVEANGAAREVLEKGFRFTPRNLGIFAVFGIAVPVIIYKGCVNEFVRAQKGVPRDKTATSLFSRAPTRTDDRGGELTSCPRAALTPHSATRIRSTAAPRRSSCEATARARSCTL